MQAQMQNVGLESLLGDCSPRCLRCHSGLAHTQYSSWLSVSGRKLFLGLFFQVAVYHLGKSGQDLKQKPWRDDAYWLPRWLPLIQDHLPREVAPNSRLGPPPPHTPIIMKMSVLWDLSAEIYSSYLARRHQYSLQHHNALQLFSKSY